MKTQKKKKNENIMAQNCVHCFFSIHVHQGCTKPDQRNITFPFITTFFIVKCGEIHFIGFKLTFPFFFENQIYAIIYAYIVNKDYALLLKLKQFLFWRQIG